MNRQYLHTLLFALVSWNTRLVVGQSTDFAHDVVPVLKKHCIECHGGREAKGSFSMNTRELLVDSGHVVPGMPDQSHLLTLVASSDTETQMPPGNRPRLSDAEQNILKKWIAEGAEWEDGLSFAPRSYEPPLRPRRPTLPPPVQGRTNPVDRILDTELRTNGVDLPGSVSDAAFLRRVSLDLTGLLPEPAKMDAFMADPAPDKREKAIRQLLDDRIAYAEHWLTFFNDLLRNDYSGTGFITGGRAQISGWLYDALVTNMPFDQLARELIAPPTPASRGYIDGIRWRGEVSAGQTVEIQFAQSVAQSFLGINMKCASCHDSFIDRWKLDEAYGLAAIYSAQPLQIHRCDKPVGREARAAWLFPELGQVDPLASREERLQQLASLMTHPENGRFTRTIVNRLWYRMMGRGIVHPLDAMQSEPSSEDLLDMLAVYLADNQYDLKSVLFLIATSKAYQAQCVTQTESISESTDGKYIYRGPLPRRMTAEQFLDSVWQITEAAPTSFDAPVLRGALEAGGSDSLTLKASWIWGDSASSGQVPPAGETIAMRKTFSLADNVRQGGAVITCDNSFIVFVNGREVKRGNDWSKPEGLPLRSVLKKGQNSIIVIATNAGNDPNAAGLFFEARIKLENGEELSLASDDSWEYSPEIPSIREGRPGKLSGEWKAVTVVPALAVWKNAVETAGRRLLTQAMNDNLQMVRASLLKSDFLMRSLGRPMREQIVSMRPSELTTLEAIDLSNGATLAGYLSQGAATLAVRFAENPDGLVQHVYQFALCRQPTPDELAILRESLSSPLEPEAVEDMLWAVFMTPEFFLIR